MLVRVVVCAVVVLLPRCAVAGDREIPRPRLQKTLLDQLGLPEPGEDPAERARVILRRRQQARAELWLQMMGIRSDFLTRVSWHFASREAGAAENRQAAATRRDRASPTARPQRTEPAACMP